MKINLCVIKNKLNNEYSILFNLYFINFSLDLNYLLNAFIYIKYHI